MSNTKPISEVYNMDCLQGLKEYPDKYFQLAIVDPPYGIGFGEYERGSMGKKVKERYTAGGKKKWDSNIPDEEYFIELFRVSVNQIIWGGNYFDLPPNQGFIFWNKKQPVKNFASGEYAWTSFKRPARCFDYAYYGNINVDPDGRIHPTQKPIALYKWAIEEYATKGDKILDTHLGSQSSRIAAYKMGFDFYGFEKDADLYHSGCKRFENSIGSPLFDEPKIAEQSDLFKQIA